MRVFLTAAVLTLAAAATAAAQNQVGPRLGLSINPDQFVLGGQLTVPFSEPNLLFAPNVEIGFGDNVTTFQVNGDVAYHFNEVGPNWNPYVGAGLGLIVIDFNDNFPGDNSDTELGVNIIGGLRFKNRSGSNLFTELRLGIGDLPDAKVMVGWNFPM